MSGMMSEEDTMEDGKISRRPNWRSDKMNKWIDELGYRSVESSKKRKGG